MTENLDLLGDPIPDNWNKRGRPPHIPTQRNRIKIRLLLGLGWTIESISRALRISKPTLRAHYFAELKHADEAREALKADNLMHLYHQAQEGNVGAIKEMRRVIERDELEALSEKLATGRRTPKPEKLGKKEQLAQAASGVTGKYAPPPAPILVN